MFMLEGVNWAYLMEEHEDDSHVSEAGLWEKGKGIGVVEKHVTKCPVDGDSRW